MGRLFIGAIAAATVVCGLGATAQAAPLAKLRHGYVDDRYGQLHYAIVRPTGPAKAPPIILLHQSPNSSAEFDVLVATLGRDRVAIAIDTPGYGGSDGPATVPPLEDYAAAIAEGLKAMGYGPHNPVDVFGYHTGSKIATELAITQPGMIRKVALSGIYDPPPEQVAKTLANLHHPVSAYEMIQKLGASLDQTRARYEKMGLTDAQWGKIRIDSLRGMTRQEFGHESAFRYAGKFKARMKLVTQPVLLVPMDDGLAEATRGAKGNFQRADVTATTYGGGGFFTQAEAIAADLNAFAKTPR